MSIINLLPEDYLITRARTRANVLCLVLFTIVMAGVLGAYLTTEQSSRRTREVRDQVDAAYADAAKLIAQMHQLEEQKRTMLHKAESTASLVERVPRSTVLAIITNALPKDASLTQVNMATRRVVSLAKSDPAAAKGGKGSQFDAVAAASAQQRATQLSPATVELEVTGLAGTDVEVAKFIANLARSPLLTSVDLVYSQEKMIEKAAVREFRVRLELKNDADAIDAVRQVQPETRPANDKLAWTDPGGER